MKPIIKKNLIEKSRNNRNAEIIQKLANRDSLIAWSKSEITSTPKVKIEKPKKSVGWYNFCQLVKQLNP